MKIATLNINGYRAAMKKGLAEWMEEEKPDVVCLQEIKIMEHQANVEAIEALGYKHEWFSAEKPGYAGVATMSRLPIDRVEKGCGIEKYDREGRILVTDIGGLTIVNAYFPSGSSSDARHDFKMEFLEDLKPWFLDLVLEHPNLVVCGDYNIVHKDMDIHNPERRDNPSGFRPEERAWLDEWFSSTFTDAWRHLNPDLRQYSWWSYRAGSRPRDKGWRIDYISVSDSLKGKIVKAVQQKEAFFSDHCPVVVELDLS
jgi:exodeoxyribonuclease III